MQLKRVLFREIVEPPRHLRKQRSRSRWRSLSADEVVSLSWDKEARMVLIEWEKGDCSMVPAELVAQLFPMPEKTAEMPATSKKTVSKKRKAA